jgi:hypothetical protein
MFSNYLLVSYKWNVEKHSCPNIAAPVLGLLANLKQHARLSEACLVEATSDNDLSIERNSMSN